MQFPIHAPRRSFAFKELNERRDVGFTSNLAQAVPKNSPRAEFLQQANEWLEEESPDQTLTLLFEVLQCCVVGCGLQEQFALEAPQRKSLEHRRMSRIRRTGIAINIPREIRPSSPLRRPAIIVGKAVRRPQRRRRRRRGQAPGFEGSSSRSSEVRRAASEQQQALDVGHS